MRKKEKNVDKSEKICAKDAYIQYYVGSVILLHHGGFKNYTT
jgi:hypothetical protein